MCIVGFVVGTQVEPSLNNFMCSTVDFMYTFVKGSDNGETIWLGLEELNVKIEDVKINLGDVPDFSDKLVDELN